MVNYKHFLITIFNLRTNSSAWKTDKNGKETLTNEWMLKRLELFWTYCFPSIRQQSNKNFTWLVFFDSEISHLYKEEINIVATQNSFFVPKFVKIPYQIKNLIKNEIIENLQKDVSHVITTRLDNDDALHKDAIFAIQQCFDGQEYQIINFSRGYTFQIVPEKVVAKTTLIDGPFISLIEKRNGQSLHTIYAKQHTEYIKDNKVLHIGQTYYWLRLIHDSNLLNYMEGTYIFKKSITFKDFGIAEKISINRFYLILCILKQMLSSWIPTFIKQWIKMTIIDKK